MEKKEAAIPNERLRRERKIRGWSQNYLAGLIGTDPKVVSRWERGIAFPAPGFQRKLCELFVKNALELGFLTEGVESGPGDTQLDNQQLPDQVPQTSDQSEGDQESGQTQTAEQARSDQGEIAFFLDRLQKIINQLKAIVVQLQDASHRNRTLKDELKDAYIKLLIISEARLNCAGTVETLRRYNGEVAYERLPVAKAELESAEQAFDEAGIYRILALLDNNKVWIRYYKATQAFQQYKERTRNLVEEALRPLSLLSRRVPRLDALLNPKLDEDPLARKIYEQMYNEMDAMQKAMNKRLRF